MPGAAKRPVTTLRSPRGSVFPSVRLAFSVRISCSEATATIVSASCTWHGIRVQQPGKWHQALGIRERRVTVNLDRLTDGGLLTVASDGAPAAARSYVLPPAGGEAKQALGA